MSSERTPDTTTIAIIGAGFGGLCLAIRLKQAGIHSFTIFEREARLGGTWRDNTYPGAACDLPSFSYCYSFEQKLDWTRKWSPQPEILAYIEHCAKKYALESHIHLGTSVEGARFDAAQGVWVIRTSDGRETRAQFLVSSVGQLNRPSTPKIAGLSAFRGESFHSARWNQDYDLRDKRVAVIGNAASAVQFIPEIAKQVRQLHVFQRSANWILSKGDYTYGSRAKGLFRTLPFTARLYRWWIWLSYEIRFPLLRGNELMAWIGTQEATKHIEAQVPDPELRKALTPPYRIGAKRILISDDYYPALMRDNVGLVTDGIDHVDVDGIVTKTGESIEVDAIIFGTGFDSTSFLVPMKIEGPTGRTLEDAWSDGAEAYLGLSVAEFPNFFMMYGPNTNLGHNSIIFMLECQTRYIMDAIRQMQQRGLKAIELRRDVMEEYNQSVQRELAQTMWATVDQSWYMRNGRITNNWYGSTALYWWKTRRADLGVYEQVA